MFCVKCGNQIADGNSFCGNCGSSATAEGQGQVDVRRARGAKSNQPPLSVKEQTAKNFNMMVHVVSIIMMIIYIIKLFVRGFFTISFTSSNAPVEDILCLVAIAVAMFASLFCVVFSSINNKQFNKLSVILLVFLTVIMLSSELLYFYCENVVMKFKSSDQLVISFISIGCIFLIVGAAACVIASIISLACFSSKNKTKS